MKKREDNKVNKNLINNDNINNYSIEENKTNHNDHNDHNGHNDHNDDNCINSFKSYIHNYNSKNEKISTEKSIIINNNDEEKYIEDKINFRNTNFFMKSGSEYSEQDFFNNNKYSKVNIQTFKEIIYYYDINVYQFYMNLILYSKIDLIKMYKNKIFSVQINSADILQYALNTYMNFNNNTSDIEEEFIINKKGWDYKKIK